VVAEALGGRGGAGCPGSGLGSSSGIGAVERLRSPAPDLSASSPLTPGSLSAPATDEPVPSAAAASAGEEQTRSLSGGASIDIWGKLSETKAARNAALAGRLADLKKALSAQNASGRLRVLSPAKLRFDEGAAASAAGGGPAFGGGFGGCGFGGGGFGVWGAGADVSFAMQDEDFVPEHLLQPPASLGHLLSPPSSPSRAPRPRSLLASRPSPGAVLGGGGSATVGAPSQASTSPLRASRPQSRGPAPAAGRRAAVRRGLFLKVDAESSGKSPASGGRRRHLEDFEALWRKCTACAGKPGGVAKVLQEAEARRLRALWGAYLQERRLRGTRRAFRVCERLHAQTLTRLAEAEGSLEDQEAVLKAQAARESARRRQNADLRERLQALESQLHDERGQRLQEGGERQDAKVEAELALQALRARAVQLEGRLREQLAATGAAPPLSPPQAGGDELG